MPKTARQISHAKKAARLMKKDPEYFAKLAARRKGEKNPNMARSNAAEAGKKGGLMKNGTKHRLRKERSAELQEKLKKGTIEHPKAKIVRKINQERKERKHGDVWEEKERVGYGWQD